MRSFRKRPAEPSALRIADNAEAIIAGRDAEIADLRGAVADLRGAVEFREMTIDALRVKLADALAAAAELMPAGMVTVSREHLDMLAGRAAWLQHQVTAVRPVLERFAEPGAMTATARRQAAAEALRSLDAAAGEAVAADEPA